MTAIYIDDNLSVNATKVRCGTKENRYAPRKARPNSVLRINKYE